MECLFTFYGGKCEGGGVVLEMYLLIDQYILKPVVDIYIYLIL